MPRAAIGKEHDQDESQNEARDDDHGVRPSGNRTGPRALRFNALACRLATMSNQIPQHIDAWKAISRAHARIRAHIDSTLKDRHLPPFEMFEALDAITGGASTAKDLETRLDLPQYGVSRLLDRMERAALVRRVANDNDQRSKTITITDEGTRVMHDQKAAYEAALAGFLGPRAKPGQLERMATLLALLDADMKDA